jgi:hypothetical protein
MAHITTWEEDYKGNNNSPSLQSPLANSLSPSCMLRFRVTINKQPLCLHNLSKGIFAIRLHLQSKAVPQHTMEPQEERRYSSCSFMTSTLDGVSGQLHAPAALYHRGKDLRYPLDRRLGGPQNRSGHRG